MDYTEKHLYNYQIMARHRTPHDTTMQKCIQASTVKQVKELIEVLKEMSWVKYKKRQIEILGSDYFKHHYCCELIKEAK